MTICFHVDDCKLSHKSPKVNDRMIRWLKREYKSIFEDGSGEMSVSRGKIHTYLGMTLDYTLQGRVVITMFEYINEIVSAYDKADPNHSGTAGANDWHCERAWVKVAHTHVDRDRTRFQQTCAVDKDELTRFLEKRQAGIDKLKSRHGHEKRRGAKIKRATCQHTLNRSTTLLTSQHLWTKHQAPSRNSN